MKQRDKDQKERVARKTEEESPREGSLEPRGKEIGEEAEELAGEAQQEVAAARRPWYQVVRWGYVLLSVYGILLVLFGLLAWWVHYHPVLAIDVTITREFQENQSPWLRDSMMAVSYIGNVAAISAGLVVLAALIFWLLDLRLEAIMIVVVSATSGLLNQLIKFLVARPRPSASLVEIFQTVHGQSFPSGHVMSYVAFWGLLFSFAVILFEGKQWWRIALLVISALFVILVGPSRIYLGDHWASDVLGGHLFGGLWLGFALWVYLKLRERGILAPRRKRRYIRHPGYHTIHVE